MSDSMNYTSYQLSSSNTNIDAPYDNLVVSFDQSRLSDSCVGSPSALFSCKSLHARTALYWMHLLKPLAYNLTLRLYPSDQLEQWEKHIDTGDLDITDKEMVVTPYAFTNGVSFHITTPVSEVQYLMYTSWFDEEKNADETSLEFLSAPFSRVAWIFTLIAIILAYSMSQLIWIRTRSMECKRPLSYRLFAIVLFGCAFLAATYKSSLNAFLTVPRTTNGPFRDLFDLSRQVTNGSKRLIIDDTYSLRWVLVTNKHNLSFAYPPFRALYHAINRVGQDRALIFEPNMTVVCQMVQNSSEYVYFGPEQTIRANNYCSQLCFRTYTVSEIPAFPLSWAVSKKSILGESANILVHGLESFREAEARRLLPPAGCIRMKKPEYSPISESQLEIAFLWLLSGHTAAVVICVMERLYSCKMIFKRRRRLARPSSTLTIATTFMSGCPLVTAVEVEAF